MEHRTGDVAHLRTCRTWILYHCVQHLCSHDDRLLPEHTFLNYQSLYARNLLCRYLYAEITASHHNAVAMIQYLVNIVHSLLILYL